MGDVGGKIPALPLGLNLLAGIHRQYHAAGRAFGRADIQPQIKRTDLQNRLLRLPAAHRLVHRLGKSRVRAKLQGAAALQVAGRGLEQLPSGLVAGKDVFISVDENQPFPHAGGNHGKGVFLLLNPMDAGGDLGFLRPDFIQKRFQFLIRRLADGGFLQAQALSRLHHRGHQPPRDPPGDGKRQTGHQQPNSRSPRQTAEKYGG